MKLRHRIFVMKLYFGNWLICLGERISGVTVTGLRG